ncbi:DUF4936 family protein [Parvibium lacunae]|uniref:DUF4936 family protein n=1 Tax=Parvibium lacunae TaxID=1888893 RepID=A0A368L7P4_9BURK|nr:DUF4936 family protein [Parvibium lacunae]RCS59634.1 DUF4936 family protein [Parvibium lacunae]
MSASMLQRTIYVYFKAPYQDSAAVMQAAQLQLAEMAAEYSLSGRLQCRQELLAVDSLQTWLEIYEHVPANLDGALFKQANKALQKLISGERHVEVFVTTP